MNLTIDNVRDRLVETKDAMDGVTVTSYLNATKRLRSKNLDTVRMVLWFQKIENNPFASEGAITIDGDTVKWNADGRVLTAPVSFFTSPLNARVNYLHNTMNSAMAKWDKRH